MCMWKNPTGDKCIHFDESTENVNNNNKKIHRDVFINTPWSHPLISWNLKPIVAIMPTCVTAINDKVGIMTTHEFHCFYQLNGHMMLYITVHSSWWNVTSCPACSRRHRYYQGYCSQVIMELTTVVESCFPVPLVPATSSHAMWLTSGPAGADFRSREGYASANLSRLACFQLKYS